MCATTATAATINAVELKQRLNTAALSKLVQGQININALVDNDSNDLLIEYDTKAAGTASGQEQRNLITEGKSQFKSKFTKAVGFQTLREFNGFPLGLYRIQNRETLARVLSDPSVKAVYPNRKNVLTTMQSLPLINQPQVVNSGYTGEGTSVAVLDTGVNYTHDDFGKCTAVNSPASTCRVVYAFDSAPNDNSLDDHGHGSNVSGIIAKVAPSTKIIGIDVFRKENVQGGGTRNVTYDSDLLAGLNWTVNNAKAYSIKAVNLSIAWAGVKYTTECRNSSYSAAFVRARNVGVVPVVAAGNDGFADGITSPACATGAVRVGAVYDSNIGEFNSSVCNESTTQADQVTCFSNGGSLVTLLAPGAYITAGGYNMRGTSQAALHVAGVIALLRSNNLQNSENIDQTIYRLRATGKQVTDTRTGLVFPRVDVLAAFRGNQ
nr:S8 family serine peptidase [Acinetobacter sp. ANC 3882]